MPNSALGRTRLITHGLAGQPYGTPLAAVEALGAMQGQELGGVISSIALRTSGKEAHAVTDYMTRGEIVRGYPMRGTVFAVSAADLAWMTQLCAGPAVRAAQRRRVQLDLDTPEVERARTIALERLSGERNGIDRRTLFSIWEASGQSCADGRGYHLLVHLISTGSLCYGPWNGTDQNIVAAASWLPAKSDLEGRFNGDRIAAVAELLRRYLCGHGPATLHDFAWWTKIPLRDIRAGFSLISGEIAESPCRPDSYQRPGLDDEVTALTGLSSHALLLPGFDEFILGYPDRLFAMDEAMHNRVVPGNNGVFRRTVVIGGTVRALWRTTGRAGRGEIMLDEFADCLSDTQRRLVERRFRDFPFPWR